ncbi:hypothetical protein KFL_000140300 [Klebsormidium nitens]|uniref:MYND-type domain-containing protein n=1 Tax=Klebsormidium nitens TaxID=105231 RepID=A0A1Y1HJ17_KLENI|nr:hypothetical protein KFL_000140300 [Klebsormidium nitens]|eukprot:GAQ78510.1 hypothetical protein KFL_000140300 [Klebsormidium nitens]
MSNHRDATLRGYLPALYEKAKFCRREDCLKAQIAKLQDYVQFATPEVENSSCPPDNLYLTVKTLEFVLKMDQSLRCPGVPEELSGVVYRPFSKDSGELFVAAVLGSETGDNWIGHSYLSQWNMSEEEVIDLGFQNIDKITPKKLNCRQIKKPEDMPKFFSQRRSKLTPILHYEIRGSSGLLHVDFADQRALPRLLLPRVIERFAEILKCDATSLVFIPFDNGSMHVGNAEDRIGMLNLSIIQKLPQLQGDPTRAKFRVTWNPFRVSNPCNEKGLVELEPYLVNGGRIAVQFWEKDKMKIFHPMPRTKDDITYVENVMKNPSLKNPLFILPEHVFLEGVCWNCRKQVERLMKCAKCRKASYCSKECQKKAWNDGHKWNCAERREFWKKGRKQRLHVSEELREKAKVAKESLSEQDLARLKKMGMTQS